MRVVGTAVMVKVVSILIIVIILLSTYQVMSQGYNITLPTRPTKPEFTLLSVDILQVPSSTEGIATLQLNVMYLGLDYLKNVKFKLHIENSLIVSDNPIIIGFIEPGQIITLKYLVKVKVPRTYHLKLVISWESRYVKSAVGYSKVSESSGSITIWRDVKIRGTPLLSVDVRPRMLLEKSINTISFEVCNVGSDIAYNVYIQIHTSAPFIEGNYSKMYIPRLDQNVCKTLKFEVIPYAGPTTLKVSLNYLDSQGNIKYENYDLLLTTISTRPLEVSTSRLFINGSEEQVLYVEISNTGIVPLYNITLSIVSIEGALYVGNSTFEIRKLEQKERIRLPLKLIVPSWSRKVIINYLITYQLPNTNVISYRDTITLQVINHPKIVITDVTITPKTVKSGEAIVLSITFTNLASVTAYNVNVSIYCSDKLRPVSKSSIFFGKINPQTPTVAAFTINTTKPGKAFVKIEITYEDDYGYQYTHTETLNIDIMNSTVGMEEVKEKKINTTIIAVGVVACIVIIGVVIYLLRRK